MHFLIVIAIHRDPLNPLRPENFARFQIVREEENVFLFFSGSTTQFGRSGLKELRKIRKLMNIIFSNF